MSWLDRFVRVGRRNVAALAAIINNEPRATPFVRGAWAPLLTMFTTDVDAERLAALVGDEMDYRFDGEKRHVIMTWTDCRRRGYGACSDAAAAVGAGLVLCQPTRLVQLCYEDPPDAPADYAHCRVVLDGIPVEPFPFARREAESCAAVVDLRPLLLGAGA